MSKNILEKLKKKLVHAELSKNGDSISDYQSGYINGLKFAIGTIDGCEDKGIALGTRTKDECLQVFNAVYNDKAPAHLKIPILATLAWFFKASVCNGKKEIGNTINDYVLPIIDLLRSKGEDLSILNKIKDVGDKPDETIIQPSEGENSIQEAETQLEEKAGPSESSESSGETGDEEPDELCSSSASEDNQEGHEPG